MRREIACAGQVTAGERFGRTQVQNQRVLIHEPDGVLGTDGRKRDLARLPLEADDGDGRQQREACEIGMVADVFDEAIHSGTTASTQRARIIEPVPVLSLFRRSGRCGECGCDFEGFWSPWRPLSWPQPSLSIPSPVWPRPLRRTLARPNPSSKALKAEIAKVASQLKDDQAAKNRLARELRAAEMSVSDVRKSLDGLRAERAEHARRRAALAEDKKKREDDLARERDALAGQLRAAYLIGSDEPLKLLLNQKDPARAGRMFAYYSYFGRARAEQIDRINANLDGDREVRQRDRGS